jgi:hypothetical protein
LYYFDHREEIEGARERDRLFEEEMKKTNPSIISPEKREAYLRAQGEQPERG